jgi:hypothetical protein
LGFTNVIHPSNTMSCSSPIPPLHLQHPIPPPSPFRVSFYESFFSSLFIFLSPARSLSLFLFPLALSISFSLVVCINSWIFCWLFFPDFAVSATLVPYFDISFLCGHDFPSSVSLISSFLHPDFSSLPQAPSSPVVALIGQVAFGLIASFVSPPPPLHPSPHSPLPQVRATTPINPSDPRRQGSFPHINQIRIRSGLVPKFEKITQRILCLLVIS